MYLMKVCIYQLPANILLQLQFIVCILNKLSLTANAQVITCNYILGCVRAIYCQHLLITDLRLSSCYHSYHLKVVVLNTFLWNCCEAVPFQSMYIMQLIHWLLLCKSGVYVCIFFLFTSISNWGVLVLYFIVLQTENGLVA